MGLFEKFKAGLQKTHAKLTHEIKRIVTRSPKLTAGTIEELEAALIAADLGMPMTAQSLGGGEESFVRRFGLAQGGVRFDGGVHGGRERHGQDDDVREAGAHDSSARTNGDA